MSTPILPGDCVAVFSGSNGTRPIGFDPAGAASVMATHASLTPDMHMPVATAGRLYAIHRGKTHCLAAADLDAGRPFCLEHRLGGQSSSAHGGRGVDPSRCRC